MSSVAAALDTQRAERDLPPLVHQLCASHILRDLVALAEAHPDEHWPTQIANALRELIHATNTARDAGHDAIDETAKAELLDRFRHGVPVGLKDIPRTSGRLQVASCQTRQVIVAKHQRHLARTLAVNPSRGSG